MPAFLKLEGVDRATIVKGVAIYLIVTGILSLCGGVLLIIGGAAAGLGAVVGGASGEFDDFAQQGLNAAATQGALSGADLEEAQANLEEAREALEEAGGAAVGLGVLSGLLLCFGIFSVLSGPLSIVVGAGAWTQQKWARMGVAVVAGISAVASLLGLLTGQGFWNLITLLISAFIAYFFYSDPEIKSFFESAKLKNS
jgi:hypothetical protein